MRALHAFTTSPALAWVQSSIFFVIISHAKILKSKIKKIKQQEYRLSVINCDVYLPRNGKIKKNDKMVGLLQMYPGNDIMFVSILSKDTSVFMLNSTQHTCISTSAHKTKLLID